MASGAIFYRLAVITPREQADLFVGLFGPLLGIPLLYGGFYIGAGLTLLCSRSLQVFFDYQYGMAASPWIALSDRLLRGFQRDSSVARLRRDIARRQANRKVLTRALLEGLDDWKLVQAVVDYVLNQTEQMDDDRTDFQIVSAMPHGFQAVFHTWWVHAEVSNGGFHQYFYNKDVDWAFSALEGYKLFGEDELAGLMARAIEIYLKEEPDQLAHRLDEPLKIIERYVAARDESTLPELDNLFYKAVGEKGAVRYIRAHLDEFITG
jgi:hypothetical protein